MDNELFKLKIKKYLSQYEYLVNELEETTYLFEKYKIDFLKENKKPGEQPCEQPETFEIMKPGVPLNQSYCGNDQSYCGNDQSYCGNNQSYCGNKDVPEQPGMPEQPGVPESVNDKMITKLYRKLCLKAHPDKNENYKKQFEQISEAYDKKDFLKLLILANQLNIDIEVRVDIELFDKSINDVNEQISKIKSTLAWNWASYTPAQKEQAKLLFLF